MIAVALDGFLRSDKGVPVPYAIKIFGPLTEMFPTAVLTDGDVKVAEQWLLLRGLTKYVHLVGNEVRCRTGETLRQAQIVALRTQGPLEFLIDPDPVVVAWALSTGTPALLHVHPSYSRPEFRPEPRTIRTWADITDELDRQAEMIAADSRLVDATESLRWE